MSRAVAMKIDGKDVKAEEGQTILQAAKMAGITIPTLCFNEKLEPYGGCRLCTVEITSGKRTRLVTACTYPVEDGLEVKTKSDRVIKVRKMILELLLPLADTGPIRSLADEYGVKSRFEAKPTDCILCGLCVRYCSEIKKANAITFIGRGAKRQIAFVPEIAYDTCPACRECFPLCPGGKIMKEVEGVYSLSVPISERVSS